ncbi:MAG: hypothetical protein ACI9BW_002216 [Gammaproteobacteria bacterium]|jgi:hypothetical protein
MKPSQFALAIIIGLTLFALSLDAHAGSEAAKVVYAFGQVQSNTSNGKGRRLQKGDLIYPGETIATRRGRTQVRFTDGGFASLQPNTRYRIDDYIYAGKANGKERSFLSLIRGSVRLVTGIIGKADRSRFRIKTKVATIGIRGTTGEISHCDTDCGDMPVGTQMQGYGGTWDLVSGSFSGPVEAGDAYLCDGTSCQQIQGGVAQREDISGLVFDEDEEQEEDIFQQGQQVDRDGVLCDLGGRCGDTVVLTNQVAAGAFQGSPGESDAEEGIAIVLFGGVPIAGIAIDAGVTGPDVSISTTNFGVLSSALNAFPDPEIVAMGNQILSQVSQETIDALNSNPASVAIDDFGPTSDNLLTKGRFTDGYILDIDAFESEPISIQLTALTNFKSEHFIYGSDPGPISFGGTGTYGFTGGTFSTATDGSSIGLGVTAGQLMWDFGLASGSLNMTVEHGPDIFNVNGSLQGIGDKFFEDNAVAATSGMGSYPVSLDGFFSGPISQNAPPAAGLAYVIDMSMSQPYDIIGVAGFGLNAASGGASPPAPPPPAGPVALAPGSYFAWAHAFIDSGSGNNSNGADAIVNGTSVVATAIGTDLDTFSAGTGDFVCTPTCTFNAGTATIVESGSMPSIGASWVRWSANHAFAHPQLISNLGDAHLIKLDAPSTPIPSAGTGNYTVFGGGTTPTMSFGPGGGSLETATASSHSIGVDFGLGNITATHVLNFPTTQVNVTGTTSGPIAVQNSVSYSGDLIGSVSCTGCVFGHDHFTFGGANAEYVVGSGQFNTSGMSPDELAGGFTFVLGDPAR